MTEVRKATGRPVSHTEYRIERHAFDLLANDLNPPEHTTMRRVDYEMVTEEQLYERGAQLSINNVPLRWEI